MLSKCMLHHCVGTLGILQDQVGCRVSITSYILNAHALGLYMYQDILAVQNYNCSINKYLRLNSPPIELPGFF